MDPALVRLLSRLQDSVLAEEGLERDLLLDWEADSGTPWRWSVVPRALCSTRLRLGGGRPESWGGDRHVILFLLVDMSHNFL